MTETTGCVSITPLWGYGWEYARTGGTLVANTIVKIVDAKGKSVDIGEKGEVSAFRIVFVAERWKSKDQIMKT